PSAWDDDLNPVPVATAQDRRYAASALANVLHRNFTARVCAPDFIPRNWRQLWSADLFEALQHFTEDDIRHAMEAAEYESQQKYNVTCKGFVTNLPLLLDRWNKVNKKKRREEIPEYQKQTPFNVAARQERQAQVKRL